MKKLIKITTSILLIFIMGIVTMIKTNAASDTISIGQAYKVGHNYIANVTFSYKVTTDGRYLYCLDLHRNTASNTEAKLVSNSSYVDGGLQYILKNGFPEKSITGDNDKDYYITQTAVWWYLDSTHGMSNLGNKFKKTGSDPYNLRGYVENLVNEGIAHRNDPLDEQGASLKIEPITDDSLVLTDGYFISNDIKATESYGIGEYTVTIDNPIKDMSILLNGNEFAYTGGFKVGINDSFKIKVPSSSVSDDATINLTAKADGNTIYRAYEYQPVNTKMQNVVLLEKNGTSAESSTKLTISTTLLSINKIDAKTKPLAGAVLALKDSNGKQIAKWTSTVNAHIIKNLPEGTYTVEELSAPKGYILNPNPVTVKITKDKRAYNVIMQNTAKNIVININKIDESTKKPLKGAVLVIKDSSNKVVVRFTTTEEAYVITDIANGTYTVEEESAPDGYIKSNEKVTFTVDDNHQTHQIIFANTKETPVPDTGTESIIFALIGTIILGIGLDYVLKHAKA